MEKLKALIKKVCTKEVIFYAIFGVLTTLVNLSVFAILNSVSGCKKCICLLANFDEFLLSGISTPALSRIPVIICLHLAVENGSSICF